MAVPRPLVLRAPGINCDEETVFAWERAGAQSTLLHVNRLIEQPRVLDGHAILTIPGGFSYGDDIASGKILAIQLSRRLGDALARFVDRGALILGICNGFQVLVRLGLLPGEDAGVRATLTRNESGRYEDRWVRLRAEVAHSPFVENGDEFDFPVGHGEGRLAVEGGEAGIARLVSLGRVAMRYVRRDGRPASYPENPNGSIGNAAALTDRTGRVFGLMPHPDRNLFPTSAPAHIRGINTESDGLRFFRGIVRRLR